MPPSHHHSPSRRALVGVVALVLVALVAPPASAATAYAHWSQRSLVISDRTGDAGWQLASQRAVDTWNSSGADIRLTWREGGIGCGFSGSVIPVCRDRIRDGWTGATRWSTGGDGHLDGNVVLVDATRDFSQPLKDAIVCHELGHVLGLNHTSDASSCLNHRSRSARPSARDVANVRALYGHAR